MGEATPCGVMVGLVISVYIPLACSARVTIEAVLSY